MTTEYDSIDENDQHRFRIENRGGLTLKIFFSLAAFGLLAFFVGYFSKHGSHIGNETNSVLASKSLDFKTSVQCSTDSDCSSKGSCGCIAGHCADEDKFQDLVYNCDVCKSSSDCAGSTESCVDSIFFDWRTCHSCFENALQNSLCKQSDKTSPGGRDQGKCSDDSQCENGCHCITGTCTNRENYEDNVYNCDVCKASSDCSNAGVVCVDSLSFSFNVCDDCRTKSLTDSRCVATFPDSSGSSESCKINMDCAQGCECIQKSCVNSDVTEEKMYECKVCENNSDCSEVGENCVDSLFFFFKVCSSCRESVLKAGKEACGSAPSSSPSYSYDKQECTTNNDCENRCECKDGYCLFASMHDDLTASCPNCRTKDDCSSQNEKCITNNNIQLSACEKCSARALGESQSYCVIKNKDFVSEGPYSYPTQAPKATYIQKKACSSPSIQKLRYA